MGRRRTSRFDLPPRLYEHHGSYWFRPRYGKPINLGKDLSLAKLRWAQLDLPANETGSVSALLDWYLSEVAPKKAVRTYKDNLKEAVNLKAGLGHIPYRELRPHHIAAYRDARALDAPVRANREKALLSHVFTKAIERGWVDLNPCAGVKRNTERKRERYIEDEEYWKVYNLAEKSVQNLMTLMYRTAQRPEDLLQCGPSNIKLVREGEKEVSVLRFKQQKTGVSVDIKLQGDLELLVQNHLAQTKIHPYFVHTRMGDRYTYDGLTSMFSRYVSKAGLKDFGIYDLKGKAATDMYRSGVPLEKIQHLLGHSSITTTERYIKARMPSLVESNKVILRVDQPEGA
jgi:integrase